MPNRDLGILAKQKLEEFVPTIDVRIGRYFDEEIKLDFGFNKRQKTVVKEALVHAKEYILRPTKRLRASFVNYGYLLGSGDLVEKVWRAAVGVELVHVAILMHDDFMDQDNQRRRGPSTHRFYQKVLGGSLHHGESMAVTVGDVLLCLGFELVQGVGSANATKQLLRGIANTAYGQAYDVTLEALANWTEEDVIVLHQAKTAIYTYENPLFIGAHLAGLPKKAFGVLHDYAMDGGVAFQLQDDILGVYGNPEKTGKSADSDLRQGKCTLLVLKVFTDGTKMQKQKLRQVWGKFHEASREDLDAAKQVIRDSGSYEYSRQLAKKYAAAAAKTAGKLRKLNLGSEAIDYIQGIAEYMVVREV